MKNKSKKRNGAKNQHFVPKSYLRAFVDPRTPEGQEPYVWLFTKDGKHKENKAPKSIFTENHLYTIQFEGEKDFTIEDNLSKIEGEFTNVMKVIKKKDPLSDREHAYLCIFIAAQLQRTLRAKRHQEEFIQQLIDQGTRMAKARELDIPKSIKDWELYKKDIHKLQLVETLPFLSKVIKQMNIAFLCSSNTFTHPFITSDDPCVLFNPDLQWQRFHGPGFGQKNSQLTCPLSPEVTVMFTWANYHGYGYLSDSEVENLNRMTRGHCDKEFVSRFPKKKWIWFRRLPLDLFFFVKFLKYRLRVMVHGFSKNNGEV